MAFLQIRAQSRRLIPGLNPAVGADMPRATSMRVTAWNFHRCSCVYTPKPSPVPSAVKTMKIDSFFSCNRLNHNRTGGNEEEPWQSSKFACWTMVKPGIRPTYKALQRLAVPVQGTGQIALPV